NADRISVGARSIDVHAAPEERGAMPRRVRIAAQSVGGGRGAQPARAARGNRERDARLRDAADRDPHRRHAAARARPIQSRSRRHPDHDAGVALSDVDVEEMAKLGEETGRLKSGVAWGGKERASIWPAIHPRLLELIKAHRSTLLFVNSRRLAERLAAALNELAGETLVQAHHGSIARPQRIEIEDNLKSGKLPALVATSSLELGIDMGAIDLVIQIEAPPSIASGMQRIGRASHQVGAISSGIIFPKYRADLIACAAVTRAMHDGRIEPTRYQRNPLDVLAQQIVAMVSMEEWNADDLFNAVRCAAPYAELTRGAFDGVLDMLSGL